MNLDSEDDFENAQDGFAQKLAIGLTFILGLAGIIIYFVYGISFLDLSMVPYLLGYIFCLVGLFFALRQFRVPRIAGLGFLMLLIILATLMRIDWQKQYYNQTDPFLFAAYIGEYPSWEQHLLAPVAGFPDWVRYTNECAKPALSGDIIQPFCESYQSIKDRYNLDMNVEVEAYLARMRHTASLIQRRGTMTAPQYKNCVYERDCAEIPLLPDGVDPETLDPTDERYISIMRAFWDLAEAKPLSAEICQYMVLCQALKASGALRFE